MSRKKTGSKRDLRHFLFFILLVVSVFAQAEGNAGEPCENLKSPVFYRLKRGDQVGKVARVTLRGPLWGRGKLVDRVVAHNQNLDPHHVKIGQKVYLPFTCESQTDRWEIVDHGSERELLLEPRPTLAAPRVEEGTVTPVAPPEPRDLASVPAEAETPSPSPEPSSPASPTSNSKIQIDGLIEYSAILGRDVSDGTTGRLITDLNHGLQATWRQDWSEQWGSALQFRWKSLELLPERRGVTVIGKNQDLLNFNLQLERRLSPTLISRLHFGLGDQLFYQANTTGSGLEVNKVKLTETRIQFESQLLHRDPLSVSVDGSVDLFGSGRYDDYSISSGLGFELGLQLRESKPMMRQALCRIFYGERRQETSYLQLQERRIGGTCGFAF